MADFIHQQKQFAQAVRVGADAPTGVSEGQMLVYRDLCRNNVFSFIDGAFPVCREVIDEGLWLQLKEDYFSASEAESPFFRDISQQFYSWLALRPQTELWVQELAHYELAEMKADIAAERYSYTACPAGIEAENWLDQRAIISSTAMMNSYRFSVHTISAENPDAEPGETPLVVFRDTQDTVRFLLLNPLSFSLLQTLSQEQIAVGQAVMQCLQQFDLLSEAGVSGAFAQIHAWWSQGLIRQLRTF